MNIWIDAHISPQIAFWITERFKVPSKAVRDLELAKSTDRDIFEAARKEKAVIMTKDNDFVAILEQKGPPPQVIWITCGNTSNNYLRKILEKNLPRALELLSKGEPLVEISSSPLVSV